MAGELVVADLQIQLRNWLGGPGTSCDWNEEVLDFFGANQVRTYDTVRTSTDGVRGGRDLYDKQVLTGAMFIKATSNADLLASISALKAGWERTSDDLPLVMSLLGVKWRRYGRPRRCGVASQVMTRFQNIGGYGAFVTIQFEALDPFIYADAQQSAVTGVPQLGAGFTPPFTPPFTLPASVSTGSIAVYNGGNASAPWQARIDGPINPSPSITNVATGEFLLFDNNGGLTINAGEYLLIDSATESVLLNGVVDRRAFLNLGSDFFDLDPGANTIQFNGTGSGTLTFTWRDTYLP